MKKVIWWCFAILLLGGICFMLLKPNSVKEGVKALEQGEYKKAITVFEEQIQKNKLLGEAFMGQSIAYYELEEYESCVACLQKAKESGEVFEMTTYRFWGNALMELERYEEAIKVYCDGMSAGGESAVVLQEMKFNCVVAYERLADWKNAKKCIEEYVALYPEDEKGQREFEFLKTR